MDTKYKKRLTIEIDPELHAKAKYEAYREGRTIKQKVIDLLVKWLKI